MDNSILELREILFAYQGKGKTKWIFNHVSYQFSAGTMYTVYGEKGSGKTTLLLLLSALEVPSVGMMYYLDTEIWRIGGTRYRKYYVSLIKEKDNLLLYYNALQNVLEAAKISGNKEYERKEAVIKLLESVEIGQETALKHISELTQGEQQRVAIARAVASGAQIILADEPVEGLESEEARTIVHLLKKTARENNKCVILATADKALANQGDVVLQIKDQNLIEEGKEETQGQRLTREHLGKRYERKQVKQKNSSLLYKVLLKNFKSSWGSFVQFFSSTMIAVAMVFAAFSIQYMLKGFYNREGGDALHEGMGGMIMSSITVIGVLTMFLMMFSQQNYIRNRMKDYTVFKIVGIQSRTINFMMVVEYIGSFLGSVVAGLLLGNVAVLIFRQILIRNYPQNIKLPYPAASVYLAAVGVSAVIFLLSYIITQEYYVEVEMVKSLQMGIRKEKMSSRSGNWLMIIGLILAWRSLIIYAGRGTGELWYFLATFLLGVYLMVKNVGMKILIRLRERREYYYRNLLSLNQFYYRFQSNAKSMLFLFILQFLLLFYLPVQIFTMFPMKLEEEYPYDYMMYCGEEQLDYVQELSQKYQAKYIALPAVKLNVAKGSAHPMDYTKIWNQGENIGLSESSYLKLQGENSTERHLKGKEIEVVFQESKAQEAHPLDWTNLKDQPAIRLGPARNYDVFSEKNIFSEAYPLVSQKRQIDIGVFGHGMHENIVVFSDAYFQEINEGNMLVLIRVPKEYAVEVNAGLTKFAKDNLPVHAFNRQIKSLYSKTEEIETRRSENFLKIAIDIFFFLAFVFSNFFVAYQKLCSDIPYLKRKYEMLNCVGMGLNEQKKLLGKEISAFWMLPLILALFLGAVFTGVTLHMRFYTMSEWRTYLKLAVPYTILFFAVQIIGIIVMRRFLVRQVIRNEE